MSTSLAKKLRIKEGFSLLTLQAPPDFAQQLGDLPAGVRMSANLKVYNQIHWFVKNKAQMESEVTKVIGLLQDDVVCWIYYPKGSSKIQTDLTRDKGWDELLKHKALHWISLISFDETWSAFGMRLKTSVDVKKDSTPKERPIFDYIDAKAKTIRLPEDFALLLEKHEKEKALFNGLSFTNRKEYVEWIVSAKREETRATRVFQSVERLAKGWKNPANR